MKPEHRMMYLLHAKGRQFQRKLDSSIRLIDRSLGDNSRSWYISWSGGKDSTAMLHMLHGVNPDLPVMHLWHPYKLPDSAEFVESLPARLGFTLTKVMADVDLLELCEEFGLPHQRTHAEQASVVRKLKKDVAANWADEQGHTGVFWGIRGDESLARKALRQYHHGGVSDKRGRLRVSPIIDWTATDVWAYHVINDLPWSGCYDKENCGESRESIRNTGWLSTDGENRGRVEWLRRNYPEQFRMLRDLL